MAWGPGLNKREETNWAPVSISPCFLATFSCILCLPLWTVASNYDPFFLNCFVHLFYQSEGRKKSFTQVHIYTFYNTQWKFYDKTRRQLKCFIKILSANKILSGKSSLGWVIMELVTSNQRNDESQSCQTKLPCQCSYTWLRLTGIFSSLAWLTM